jgi:hypothetical protein
LGLSKLGKHRLLALRWNGTRRARRASAARAAGCNAPAAARHRLARRARRRTSDSSRFFGSSLAMSGGSTTCLEQPAARRESARAARVWLRRSSRAALARAGAAGVPAGAPHTHTTALAGQQQALAAMRQLLPPAATRLYSNTSS